ncbi:MAG: hypothetical protein UT61_C0020G0011 [Candidatus Woesebacteria bacterium GW2011_GWA1_39_8]|uniref:Glycosyltransferase RgtA/B/C/D-like domain-containing protein n=1 Tax=Candidatus Woesebacteria bacterium GW2011_GWA1_39_8 TaxID=1618552 RepID=A0A0G0PPM3_9BACT|nr:MAG: hypothetical protein UT61_C0020G0011 [Candidatus Woesebacteria bacterium GW2011_GWA1_39_8]
MIKNSISKIKSWMVNNKNEALAISLILVAASFLRLYKIDQYMTFLGDEGRDVIIVRRLLVDFDIILVGPGTSIGNMYLGPIYYYMMAPALLLANFSPVGPAVMIALLGVTTVFFVWFVAREWFGKLAALVAALLYAIAPTITTYSRSSWNPNIMPFFALLTIYSVWKVWKKLNYRWLIVTGVSMGFVLQSHYLGLLLVPVIGLFWLLTYLTIKNSKLEIKSLIKQSFIGLLLFSVLMSPLVIFDARHDWRNFAAMKDFFTQRQTTVSAKPWSGLEKLPEIANETTGSLLGAKSENLTWLYIYGALYIFLWMSGEYFFSKKKINLADKTYWKYLYDKITSSYYAPFFILFTWLFFAHLGLTLYKQHIYDHYFGFFFPAPFLLVGGLTSYIYNNFGKVWKTILAIFIMYALYVNLANNQLKYPPNRQLQRSETVANFIVQQTGSEKFNLAVIAERNYEGAYQYFLERWNAPIVIIDAQRADETITNQLYVVCELPSEKCDPTHNPKTEVANFGWSNIEGVWQIEGTTVYKLIHSE